MMPGQPVFKSKHIDQLVTDFAVIASRFDALLPPCFRYDGGVVKKGTRGDAWSIADKQFLLLGDALQSLRVVMRLHAKKVEAGRAEPDADDEAEVVVLGDRNAPAYSDE